MTIHENLAFLSMANGFSVTRSEEEDCYEVMKKVEEPCFQARIYDDGYIGFFAFYPDNSQNRLKEINLDELDELKMFVRLLKG